MLYFSEADSEGVVGHLADYHLLYATHALLPLLRVLLAFCKDCQLEGIQHYILMENLERSVERLRVMYIRGDSAYRPLYHPMLNKLKNIPSPKQQQQQEKQQQQEQQQQHEGGEQQQQEGGEQPPPQQQQQQKNPPMLSWGGSPSVLHMSVGSSAVEMHALEPPVGAQRASVRPSEITEDIKARVERQVCWEIGTGFFPP